MTVRAGYREIAAELRDRIRRHEFRPGQRIPSERDICQLYEVSPMTARQAVGVLRDEGLVETRVGRGVFVAAPAEREVIRIRRGSRIIPRRGSPAELDQLGLDPGAYVIEVRWQYTVKVYAADEVELRNT